MSPVLSHDPLSQHYNHIVKNSKMIEEVISVYSSIHIRVGSRLVHYIIPFSMRIRPELGTVSEIHIDQTNLVGGGT